MSINPIDASRMVRLIALALFPLSFNHSPTGRGRGGDVSESRSGATKDVGSFTDLFRYAGPYGNTDLLSFILADLLPELLHTVNALIIRILLLNLAEEPHVVFKHLGVLDLLVKMRRSARSPNAACASGIMRR